MSEKLIYELPKERDGVIEVVRAIPSNWCWIDGSLSAVQKLYEEGKIAENTILLISRFYSITPTIKGAYDVPYESRIIEKKKGLIVPKIGDIALRGKLFSSVVFDEAAFETMEITLDMVKELINGFIGMGYKGGISAYSGYKNNSKYDNPERCSFSHAAQPKSFISRELPPNVSLEWNEKYGGKRENLATIIETIEKLGLKEIPLQEAT